MKKTDVIAYFDKQPPKDKAAISKLADALKIQPRAVYQWDEEIPPRRALQLEKITKGALRE